MNEIVPWLPRSALADIRTGEPIARALEEWSTAWLARGSVTTASCWEPSDCDAETTGYVPAYRGKCHRLLVREDATLDIASLLLGRELGERECRARHDWVVIEHLVGDALTALGQILGNTLDLASGDLREDRFVMQIALEGDSVPLLLEAGRSALVMLATQWAGPPRRTDPLPARKLALVAQSLELGARIGASRLTLAEIDALEAGDVLLLDTPIVDPVDACIDGKPVGQGAFSLVSGDDQLRLQIERPVAQW